MAQSRVALVIGNSHYAESPLKNPDVNRQNMRSAIRDFGNRLQSADVGLFYFAGHGVQIDGNNYRLHCDQSWLFC